MADEPTVIFVIRSVFEVLWLILRITYYTLYSYVRLLLPPEPKDITDEIVLITGAGHGIGREMALRFAKLGAIIVTVDINAKGNEETVQLVKNAKGKIFKYECDVTNRTAVMELADKVRRDVGDVTILVNNAGIMPCRPILKQTEKEIRSTMEVNVNANLWMIQAFLPAMLERNHGNIVAMSSMAGLIGIRNLVPYCGSKYAARGIMDSLAIELHDDPRDTNGIHLTTVCPFIVNTGLCHRPRIKYGALTDVVEAGDAADMIVNAVRRNYTLITIPGMFFYIVKFLYNLLPMPAVYAVSDFADTGVDPHD